MVCRVEIVEWMSPARGGGGRLRGGEGQVITMGAYLLSFFVPLDDTALFFPQTEPDPDPQQTCNCCFDLARVALYSRPINIYIC
jgi:hypothetical protein